MYSRAVLSLAVVSLLGAGLVDATSAGAVAGVRCGQTIAAGVTVTLTADLRCTGEIGVHLLANSVLNLGGHSLIGPGANHSASVGIDTPAISQNGFAVADAGQVVRNGRIQNWGSGLESGAPDSDGTFAGVKTISGVVFASNGTGVVGNYGSGPDTVSDSRFENNTDGISVVRSATQVIRTVFLGNSGTAFDVQYPAETRPSVSYSRFTGNGLAVACGTSAGGQVTLSHTVLANNTTGASISGCDVSFSANVFHANDTGYTISGFQNGDMHVWHNRFEANKVGVNAGAGAFTDNDFVKNGVGVTYDSSDISFGDTMTLTRNHFWLNGDGINSTYAPLELTGNIASHNTGFGIYAPNATDGGANVADGNATSPQCTGVVCGA